MSTARFVLVALVAACSSSKTAPPTEQVPTGSARPGLRDAGEIPATCVPAAIADRGVAYVRVDGARATICYGDGSDSKDAVNLCRVIDETGAIVGPRTWDDAMAARKRETGRLDPHTVRFRPGAFEVCPPIGNVCKQVPLRFKTTFAQQQSTGAANLDGSRAFLFVRDPRDLADPPWMGVLYDVPSGEVIASVDLGAIVDGEPRLFRNPLRSFEAEFVGDRLILSDRVETGPDHQTVLLDATTTFGAMRLSDTTSSHVVIDTDTIVTIRGRTLGLVDVATVETLATFTVPGALTNNPVKAIAVTAFGGSLLVAYARPAGTIMIDRETRTATPPRPLPACP